VIFSRSVPPDSRTPRADPVLSRSAPLAGFFLRVGLVLAAALALATFGCGRGELPRVRVVNLSGRRLDQIWIRTQNDSMRVPTLGPGDSVEVRPRVVGEDLLWVTGRFAGRRIDSHGGDYVEGTGGYRFRAVIDSSGHVRVRFVRLGIW
jgi:hypothetical protein